MSWPFAVTVGSTWLRWAPRLARADSPDLPMQLSPFLLGFPSSAADACGGDHGEAP